MTLASGSRLGPFEITAKLGEGGMGEVWRAVDTRLKREVAIKVLPSAFTADPERLARFEREAQLLAQLHHPNIAAIFGLEESSGVSALVMELVDGPTLAERLAHGAMAPEECLSVARQMAEALEEAHERGIIHRDLKPANIKLTDDGRVKVLDFGLAKAMDPVGAGSPGTQTSTLMNSPTLTAAGATQLGVIMGTAAYMSPEQARGMAADRRSDVWAFGVVLYEMLAGRRLFEGDTASDTLAAVLRQEILWNSLPTSTPAVLRLLLRRCLERNPRNRLQAIAEARIAIEQAERGDRGDTVADPRAAASSGRGRWRGPAAVIGALLIGSAAGWLLHRSEAPVAGGRWSLQIPDGYSFSSGEAPELALSGDGRLQVAVVVDAAAVPHLLLRSQDEFAPRVLPETERADSPFFSPDGTWIGFFRDSAIFKLPLAGGGPVQLTEVRPTTTRGATWSRDGFIYFAPNITSGLVRVAESGGPVTAVTQLDASRDERTHRWPQALPDGSAVLFTTSTGTATEYYDDARIEAVVPATGVRKVVFDGASQARYGSGRRLIFGRGGALFSVHFNPKTLAVEGAPQFAAQNVETNVNSGAVQFALSERGAALWAPGGLSTENFFSVDQHGVATPIAGKPAPYNEIEVAPDGKKIALVGGDGGIADLWVKDLSSGVVTRLTVDQIVSSPVWSPDKSHIAYALRTKSRQSPWQMAWKLADGSREAEILLSAPRQLMPSAFTPDGTKLIYSAVQTQGVTADIYRLPLVGAHTPELLLGGPFPKSQAVLSPDGRWMAYVSNESGQPSIFVRPYPAGEGRWQISTPSGYEPRWGQDLRELFYRVDSTLYRVPIATQPGFSAGKPEKFLDRVSSSGFSHTYGTTPDGRVVTPQLPDGRSSLRTLYFDLGFARRLAETPAAKP